MDTILNQRVTEDGTCEFLIKWSGDYKPTWENAVRIEEDCPTLVARFREVSVCVLGGGVYSKL